MVSPFPRKSATAWKKRTASSRARTPSVLIRSTVASMSSSSKSVTSIWSTGWRSPRTDVFERLDDITNLIARARRDKNALLRVIDVYGLDVDTFKAIEAIASQTVKTVHHIAKA